MKYEKYLEEKRKREESCYKEKITKDKKVNTDVSSKENTKTSNEIDINTSCVEEESVQYNISINNEHDKIFRKILDDKKEATKFINKTLKYNLQEDEIEKYNRSFVTEELKNQESDIIYKLKDNIEKVQEKIDGSNMQVLAKYNLVDVNNFSVEELLKEESFISKAMLIEKTRYTEDLSEYLEKIVKEINDKKDIYTREQKEFFITIMNLVLKKKLDEEEIKKLTNKLREGDGQMLAVLETLEEENRRLLRQGRKEGKREIAKNMLKLGFDIEIICKATELSKKEIEKIKQ